MTLGCGQLSQFLIGKERVSVLQAGLTAQALVLFGRALGKQGRERPSLCRLEVGDDVTLLKEVTLVKQIEPVRFLLNRKNRGHLKNFYCNY